MIDHLTQIVTAAEDVVAKRNLAREYLQTRILESLQMAGAFRAWAFCGGTALRFLYQLPRFSEDLDFALIGGAQAVSFRDALQAVKARFANENYACEVAVNERRVVHAAFIKFRGLPRALGIANRSDETLAIKIEIDTRPPSGAGIETTLLRRHVMLNLSHHDRASLLAGKLHALLSRPYLKGRDVFDLAWYLADRTWPAPNLELLRASLQQTGWEAPLPTATSWKRILASRLRHSDWATVRKDVEPFLERLADAEWVTPEHVLPLLR